MASEQASVRIFDTTEEAQKNGQDFIGKLDALVREYGLASLVVGFASVRKSEDATPGTPFLVITHGLGSQSLHAELAAQLYQQFVLPALQRAEALRRTVSVAPDLAGK